MKRLPLILLCVVLVAIAFVLLKPSSTEEDISAVEEIDTIADIPEEPEPQQQSIAERRVYYGDTLWQGGNKTVCLSYDIEDIDNIVETKVTAMLITLTDSTPTDTCYVGTCSHLLPDGNRLKVSLGVDTVVERFDRLPRVIDASRRLSIPGTKRHKYHKTFALHDSSFDCEFGFRAFLPDSQPTWIKQFIATVMRNDIQALHHIDKGPERLLNEYYGLTTNPHKVHGIDASQLTPRQIAAHFAKVDERLYRKEYGDAGIGPIYDYSMDVLPTWQSADSSLITYHFYTYTYTMGPHGFFEDYYLTFDARTGRLLGWKDFLDEEEMKKSLRKLSRRLTAYKDEYYEKKSTELFDPAVDETFLSSNSVELLKETFEGKVYPRPALTRNGLVFSYQPYEAGSFAEGVLHFVVPYKSN